MYDGLDKLYGCTSGVDLIYGCIARIKRNSSACLTGTPGFAAKEAVFDFIGTGGRTDGCLLYVCMCVCMCVCLCVCVSVCGSVT